MLRVIASGGMATVYLARARGAGGFERLVALKVMHPHIASEPEFVDMFLDEARLAARIHHPNVVGTSDVQEDAGGLFLVMDYIEGAALQVLLRELWRKGQTIRLDVALRIFLDALAGLHAAHELSGPDGEPLHLVHRDVSPQNILVGVDGVARLTDFGVARASSRLASTRDGQLKGKLTYMSPEQVQSEQVDRRTDIYAAGVVLWEMLAGKRLIQADSDAGIVQCILDGVTRSPRDVAPEVPEAIAEACMRALRPEPDDRYATAAEFAEALETAADKAGVHIATPRAVAVFVREQSPPEKSADALAVRAEVPTVPEPCPSDRPAMREQVTAPEMAVHPAMSPSLNERSDVVSVDRERRRRNANAGVGLALGAGLVVAAAAAGWMLLTAESGRPPEAPPRSSLTASGVPLEPPSTVSVPLEAQEGPSVDPQGSPPAAPPKTAPASGGVRERSAELYGKPSSAPSKAEPSSAPSKAEPGSAPSKAEPGKAEPSPTAFRPREL